MEPQPVVVTNYNDNSVIVIYVDVEGMPKTKAEEYMQECKKLAESQFGPAKVAVFNKRIQVAGVLTYA